MSSLVCVLLVAVLALLAGVADGDAGTRRADPLAVAVGERVPSHRPARLALQALGTAWERDDRAAFVGTAADTPAAGRWAADIWRALTDLGVDRLRLRYLAPATPPPRTAATDAVVAEVTWSAGDRTAAATTRLVVDLAADGAPLASRALAGSPAPAWALRPARVVDVAGGTLVTWGPVAAERTELRPLVARARTQVATVLRSAGGGDRADLVVLSPHTSAAFGDLLGSRPADYAGIAAVTTTVDGSVRDGAGVQVVLNPAVFDRLHAAAAQIVLTHEATHAATGVATATVPAWVAEGFADFVALRPADVPVRVAAGRALAEVRRAGPPLRLPDAAAFAPGASGLVPTYEQAWLAFWLIERRYGTDAAVACYESVLAGRRVDRALRDATGTDRVTLTSAWRAELTRLARVSR